MSLEIGAASASWIKRLKNVQAHPIAKGLHFAFLAGIAWLLFERVNQIGLQSIRSHLPTSPVFYVVFVGFYLAQPLGEMRVYQYLWGIKGGESVRLFVRKRVFDFAVLAYSGEAILYLWAKASEALADRPVGQEIKDVVILSAAVSNTATVLLCGVFLLTGQMQRFFQVAPQLELYIAIAAALAMVLAVTVARFGQAIFVLGWHQIKTVCLLHTLRLVTILGLQSLLWMIALPGVPFETWIVILTLQLVLTRVPFLPNQDLVFLALVLLVAGFVEAQGAAVAGTFITLAALMQICHLISFLGTFRPRERITQPN